MTSCINVVKSVERVYPWLTLSVKKSNFENNTGQKVGAIDIGDSMVLWFIMEECDFIIPTGAS